MLMAKLDRLSHIYACKFPRDNLELSFFTTVYFFSSLNSLAKENLLDTSTYNLMDTIHQQHKHQNIFETRTE